MPLDLFSVKDDTLNLPILRENNYPQWEVNVRRCLRIKGLLKWIETPLKDHKVLKSDFRKAKLDWAQFITALVELASEERFGAANLATAKGKRTQPPRSGDSKKYRDQDKSHWKG